MTNYSGAASVNYQSFSNKISHSITKLKK